MNIILIGFMGAGKSTVGKLFAKQKSMNYIEMDDLVLRKSKRSSISEIFAIDGELRFRELEMTIAKEVSGGNDTVISTGGGIVMNKINVDYLKKSGSVVYLKARFSTLERRLHGDTTRPLFQKKTEALSLYNLRSSLYESYADHIIETDKREVSDIVMSLKNIFV